MPINLGALELSLSRKIAILVRAEFISFLFSKTSALLAFARGNRLTAILRKSRASPSWSIPGLGAAMAASGLRSTLHPSGSQSVPIVEHFYL